jgi:DMSO reductase anchor subunit
MYPAFSLVAFTTLSGLGFGAMAWIALGLGQSEGLFGWLAVPLAMLLAIAGLLASTRHLRRPDRAKYALSQWRSSWLSREGVLAIAALLVFGLYAALWLLFGWRSGLLGLLAAALSGATVYATGMIYAQLRTVPRWNTKLTPLCFIGFALASGALLVAVLVGITGNDEGRAIGAAVFLSAVAWGAKWLWWKNAEKATLASAGASVEEATGLGGIGTVRQFEAPHTGPNYLLKEMVFEVGRRRATALRRVALALGAATPLVLMLLSGHMGPFMLILALVAMMAGLMAERWLFYAEAQHAVGAYYGRR